MNKVINFIILVLHIVILATDIMTPEGTLLPIYSELLFFFSVFPLRDKHKEEKTEVVNKFLVKY